MLATTGDPRPFEAVRNRSARVRNVLVVGGSLLLLYSGPLLWPSPPDRPDMPWPLIITMVVAFFGLVASPVYAILGRQPVLGSDALRGGEILAAQTVYGWRNVDLNRLASIRMLVLWEQRFNPNPNTYFMLRDEHGARLAVLSSNLVTQRALRRAVRRRRASMRLSPLAALLIEEEREHRAGPGCSDVRVVLKMTLIILAALVSWIVASLALS